MADPGPQRPVRSARLLVRGRVQGVWFRGWTRERALELGLVGFARNLPDGSVEVLAQGDPEAIDALAAACLDGPPAARVESVSRDETNVPEDLVGFGIR
ncbi:acylphosphatase [Myxococcaceae bacterium]|jgi:acylphosphatase|nr:acylphosphatase [Myxococcaceae bacterium]